MRGQTLRAAMRGRGPRRGSRLVGWSRHDCWRTARRPRTRRPAEARAAATRCSMPATCSAQDLPEFGGVAQLGREDQRERHRGRHGAVSAEEVARRAMVMG